MKHQCSSVTVSPLCVGFRNAGLAEGADVLFHSSLSSFGHVENGAEGVIQALLECIGPEGTLLMPALTGDPAFSSAHPPGIDLRTTPCWTGHIPETFRRRPGVVRSIHPTHSCVATGANAVELTRDHYRSPTPCGITSPFFRMAGAEGYIVFAGCGLECCTTLHTVEEIANVGYHLQPDVAPAFCIDMEGRRIETPCRLHSYDGPQRDFPVLEPLLREKGLLREGVVGKSRILIVDAMGLIETALDRLRFDPLYLTVLRGRRI